MAEEITQSKKEKIKNIFPSFDPETVLKRVQEKWDLSGDFPLPKWDIRCPVCGSPHVQARNWQFAYQYNSPTKYRCNVSFKCTECSAVWIHGVVITEEMFRKHVKIDNKPVYYPWREVKEKLGR